MTYAEFVELVSNALSGLAKATRVHTDSLFTSVEVNGFTDSYGVRFYVMDEHSAPDSLVDSINAALVRLRTALIPKNGVGLYWKIYTRGSGYAVEVAIKLT